MKFKVLFLLLLLIILARKLNAQNFRGGVIGGLASTDVLGIDPTDVDFYKVGFNVGAMVNFPLASGNSFQFEMMYIRKGSYQPPDSTSNVYSLYRLTLDYIELPMIYKKRLHFNIKGKSIEKLEFESGIYLGFLVKVTSANEYGPYTDPRPFNKTDPGLILGLGYSFTPKLSLNLRFSGSAIPIRNHSSNATYWFNRGEYNTVINYSLRYFFN